MSEVSPILVGFIDALIWLEDLKAQGIDLTEAAHLKAVKEAKEFADDPTLEEGADVVICILGALWRRGHSINELGEAISAKIAVNRERAWVQQDDGTFQHTPDCSCTSPRYDGDDGWERDCPSHGVEAAAAEGL